MQSLEGIKIADFSWSIVGPLTTRYLADHWATVVRVESRTSVDVLRLTMPFKDNTPGVDRGSYFCNYNVNKYGITLDLGKPEAIELAKRLVAWADIFIESFRPGVTKRWGLDYDSVKSLNPSLIYVSSSMLGQTGPYHHFAGYGTQAAALSGFYAINGWPDRGCIGAFGAYTDLVAPKFLVSAIMSALLQRRKTGKGKYIEQAQTEAALQFLGPALLDYSVNKKVATQDGNRDPYAAPHGAYPCIGEDKWCVIAVYTDEEWQTFCRIIGQPELVEDSRFATLALRKENEDELNRLVGEWTIKLSAKDVMTCLQQSGVAAGVVETAEDMHNDPQFKHRKHFLAFDNHPVIGRHTVSALPFRLSQTPAQQRSDAPCQGEHNAYVCTEILGMPDEEFAGLIGAGVFG